MQSQQDDRPAISAVLVSNQDLGRVRDSLAGLAAQVCDEPFEVVLVTAEADAAVIARSGYPEVRVVEVDSSAPSSEARNAGLAESRGQFVSFFEQRLRAKPGCLQSLLDGHRKGWAMTGCAVENNARTLTGWAAYFLEYSSALPKRPDRDFEGRPAATSYRRDVLEAVGGFPDAGYGGVNAVNSRLWESGYGFRFDPGAGLVYDAPRNITQLLRHCCEIGRSDARILLEEHDGGRLFSPSGVYRHLLAPVPSRLRRVVRDVGIQGSGRERPMLIQSFPWVASAAIACWASSWISALTGMVQRRASRR